MIIDKQINKCCQQHNLVIYYKQLPDSLSNSMTNPCQNRWVFSVPFWGTIECQNSMMLMSYFPQSFADFLKQFIHWSLVLSFLVNDVWSGCWRKNDGLCEVERCITRQHIHYKNYWSKNGIFWEVSHTSLLVI